jgi:tetratricopeptide (TPR) repeat protein
MSISIQSASSWFRTLSILALATVTISPTAAAQEHDHGATGAETGKPPEQLGKVHFETSCAPEVAAKFDRAVALLHSFWFPVAIDAFSDVLKADPGCAIADWGIALSQWGNPFGANNRSPQTLQGGWASAQKGLALGPKTPREREFISAVGELYKDGAATDQRSRVLNYAKAMEDLAAKYPADSEAQIFYALALDGTILPTDKTYAVQLKAAAILEKQYALQPDHPGVAHYIIHSYDVPALAPRALAAARRYAVIAPSAPHALHMPSHTFTRVGDWEASIASNIKSRDVAVATDAIADALHASDYLAYAYLQTAQDRAAKLAWDRAQEISRTHTGGNAFAMAAIPARYAIERNDWEAAKALEVHAYPSIPHVEAITHFVRAVGFARSGDAASAAKEITELERLKDLDAQLKDAYWTEQIEIQRLGASAWATRAEGRNDEALSLLRSASEREDATEKAAVTPGPLKPAREQLGEMLLLAHQPAQALKEFEETLTREPRRFRAVYGAAHAAQLAGDRVKARGYYQQLVEICKASDTDRPELQEARRAVAEPVTAVSAPSAAAPRTYTTNFSLTESPISENGNWENGKTVGLDWADAATVPGRAFGLEFGLGSGPKAYDDAAALLTGNWGPDQTAQATVYSVNENDNIYEEVELRLRSSLSAHIATGYEILFRCSKSKDAYAEIVRWNGPLGSFTYLDRHKGAQYGVATGDVVKATIIGNVITAYINDVQVAQATDSTYPAGHPGVGFFLQGTTGVNRDYGFTSFTASDR